MNKKYRSIYTDGACEPNPGHGGWGFVILSPPDHIKGWGGELETTSNRMELMGAIKGLEYFDTPQYIKLWLGVSHTTIQTDIGNNLPPDEKSTTENQEDTNNSVNNLPPESISRTLAKKGYQVSTIARILGISINKVNRHLLT